jgi:hypothetical protein
MDLRGRGTGFRARDSLLHGKNGSRRCGLWGVVLVRRLDVRQASLAVLQQRQQVFGMMDGSGWGGCEERVPSCLLVYGVRFE